MTPKETNELLELLSKLEALVQADETHYEKMGKDETVYAIARVIEAAEVMSE